MYSNTNKHYLTLTTILDQHIYQDNNKILTEHILDFLSLLNLFKFFESLSSFAALWYPYPLMFWIAILFSVSVWMNLPISASYVVRLHSQNNAMKSNNYSHHQKHNQSVRLIYTCCRSASVMGQVSISDCNILKCSLLWQRTRIRSCVQVATRLITDNCYAYQTL